jgi:hypothetical protein
MQVCFCDVLRSLRKLRALCSRRLKHFKGIHTHTHTHTHTRYCVFGHACVLTCCGACTRVGLCSRREEEYEWESVEGIRNVNGETRNVNGERSNVNGVISATSSPNDAIKARISIVLFACTIARISPATSVTVHRKSCTTCASCPSQLIE